MPDLITHVALSHLVRRPFDRRASQGKILPLRPLFYLGTILPDILTRPWYILFPITHDWTLCLHTPLGMLLFTGILALFFESSLRKRAFINLSTGVGCHFLLDALQKQVTGNNFWLFPFSWKSVEYGIAYAEDYLDLIPLWIGMIGIMEAGIYIWKKKMRMGRWSDGVLE